MLCVAFSRRMCCSRVWSVSTKPRLPSTSRVSPAMRPGILRMKRSFAAKKPKLGPPKSSRLPSVWPSPTQMSTPSSPGGLRMPSGSGSAAQTSRARRLPASASGPSSSTVPRKFGCCRKTRRCRRPRPRPAPRGRWRRRRRAGPPRPPSGSRPRACASARASAGAGRGWPRASSGPSRASPGSRRRPPRSGPRTPTRSTPAGRSAPRSRSGTRTSPGARPARSPAGRACTASGTPSAGGSSRSGPARSGRTSRRRGSCPRPSQWRLRAASALRCS